MKKKKTAFRRHLSGGGKKVRTQLTLLRSFAKDSYLCHRCNYRKVTRIQPGIWRCELCKTQSTGNVYTK